MTRRYGIQAGVFVAGALAGVLAGVAAAPAAPAPRPGDSGALAVERYEVKFNLRPQQALEASDGSIDGIALAPALRQSLHVASGAKPEKMVIRFLDDCGRTLRGRSWAVRLREKDGEPEITYKKRFPIPQGKEPEQVLPQAQADGFSSAPPAGFKGKVEVDWGFEKQALSLTLEPKGALAGSNLPTLAVEKAPPPLARDADARKALQSAVPYGPVEARRWTGEWPGPGDELDIEVWKVGPSFVVEAAFKFKSEDRKLGSQRRDELEKLLKDGGMLDPKDSFKTEKVLDAFKPASCP